MNTKKILGVVAVLALVAVAMVGAGAASSNVTVNPAIESVSEFDTLANAFAAIESVNNTGTQYTITVNTSHTSGGVGTDGKVVNVIINLGTNTVTFAAPATGSTGTKSQAFRVTEGSTVVINDGTLQISDATITNYASYNNFTAFKQNLTTSAWDKVTISSQYDATTYGALKESDFFATLINNYGTLTLNNVKVDGTNVDRCKPNALYDAASQYQEKCQTIIINNGKVSVEGNTVITGPTSTKEAAVAAVAIQNQADSLGYYTNGTLEVSGGTANTINGDVYVDGSKNTKDGNATLTVGSSYTLIINGNLTTTDTKTSVVADGHLTLNGTESVIAGNVSSAANSIEVKSGEVKILTSAQVTALTANCIEIKNGGTLVVPNDISLDTINGKLKSVEAGAVVIQDASTSATGNKEVFKVDIADVKTNPVTESDVNKTTVQIQSGTSIVGFEQPVTYTFVIPPTVTLGKDNVGYKYSVTVTSKGASGDDRNVYMNLKDATNYHDTAFHVVNVLDDKDEYVYTIVNGSATVDKGSDVVVAPIYWTAQETSNKVENTLTFSGITASTAGNYSDTITFELSVKQPSTA